MANIGSIIAPAASVAAHSSTTPQVRPDQQAQAAANAIQHNSAALVTISTSQRGSRAPSRDEKRQVDATFEKQAGKSSAGKKEESSRPVKKSVDISA